MSYLKIAVACSRTVFIWSVSSEEWAGEGPRGSSSNTVFNPVHPSEDVKVAITGTPGTGKSTLSELLRKEGHRVIELTAFIKDRSLLGRYDEGRDTHEVDVEALEGAIGVLEGDVILEGHLSHLLEVDLIIVLRCAPKVLTERLSGRGYSDAKIRENVEAEALDVILVESLEGGGEVVEIDTTHMSPPAMLRAVKEILAGEREKYAYGNVDWSEEVLEWY
jgi:adenylate kinase